MVTIARDSLSLSIDMAAEELRRTGLEAADAAIIAVLVAEQHGRRRRRGQRQGARACSASGGCARPGPPRWACPAGTGLRSDAMQLVDAAQQRTRPAARAGRGGAARSPTRLAPRPCSSDAAGSAPRTPPRSSRPSRCRLRPNCAPHARRPPSSSPGAPRPVTTRTPSTQSAGRRSSGPLPRRPKATQSAATEVTRAPTRTLRWPVPSSTACSRSATAGRARAPPPCPSRCSRRCRGSRPRSVPPQSRCPGRRTPTPRSG